jgi:hypothetical protein
MQNVDSCSDTSAIKRELLPVPIVIADNYVTDTFRGVLITSCLLWWRLDFKKVDKARHFAPFMV